ncbi:hypothetical protein RRG08_014008 [Elysia crispata]|uniref:Uncharacterized protein n=1 Tax=Elysia crispata TaxID=231223 RepID=A0AAE1B1G1_9GAST|nr:hypothetical protein RRG08_014008 [Elysia crispata]
MSWCEKFIDHYVGFEPADFTVDALTRQPEKHHYRTGSLRVESGTKRLFILSGELLLERMLSDAVSSDCGSVTISLKDDVKPLRLARNQLIRVVLNDLDQEWQISLV